MIYLTSNGLTNASLQKHVKQSVSAMKHAVIITTASSYKAADCHIPEVRKRLEEMALSVNLMDLEYEDVQQLAGYDVIYLLGGNPFYL